MDSVRTGGRKLKFDTPARIKCKSISSFTLTVNTTYIYIYIMVIGLTTYKSVNGFTDEQLKLMRAFLQGAVYCWCKNRKDEWFAARDLLGGDNYYWQGTPLIPLYDYYLNGDEENHDYAVE